jgi:outer membrane lipoprotein-sorting protein
MCLSVILSNMKYGWLFIFFILTGSTLPAQEPAATLVQKLKAKLALVSDYSATGKLKTDVAFLKVPVARVNVYFKRPDKFRISKEKGISILPKGGVSINMQDVLAGNNYLALDAGNITLNGVVLRIIKILPNNETGDVVISTLYIDEKRLLINKITTTTRENGSYDVEMKYGKWSNYGLPDKTIFSFNTRDYKLPKGVTLEFDDGERPDPNRLKTKKGTVEIIYEIYNINKGIPDSYFRKQA